MKENLPLWKLALKASPDSFGLIPAGFSPSVASKGSSPSVAPQSTPPNLAIQSTSPISPLKRLDSLDDSNWNDDSLEDIMPPNWKSLNYTIKNFDSVILSIYNKLKQLFPGVYVNVNNGKRVNRWCGLRTPGCTVGASKSPHKTGEALDLHHISKLNELRNFCESSEGLNLGIKRIEHRDYAKTWVHIDVKPPNESKWKDKTKPYIFIPKTT
ncbi:MAG: hypothetical protein LBC64_07675 [Fibromonadaceae bacterium]|jgi:hypothetical protein|nr:hypothetical protein [Fibromonadaceae bacterium]